MALNLADTILDNQVVIWGIGPSDGSRNKSRGIKRRKITNISRIGHQAKTSFRSRPMQGKYFQVSEENVTASKVL